MSERAETLQRCHFEVFFAYFLLSHGYCVMKIEFDLFFLHKVTFDHVIPLYRFVLAGLKLLFHLLTSNFVTVA